jgi:hypothetical protein
MSSPIVSAPQMWVMRYFDIGQSMSRLIEVGD